MRRSIRRRGLYRLNCPTGTCRTDKVCEEVEIGDPIDPQSREHVERNACNRCPSTNPTFQRIETYNLGPNFPPRIDQFYGDSEGNRWQADSKFTAPDFHGDAGLGNRTEENMTYRLERSVSGGRGWQCRYYGGALDDTSLDLGTYDYAPSPGMARAAGNYFAPSWVSNDHNDMDVVPHNANPNYAPNLTEKF